MAILKWDEKYSVNISLIDEQHKVLLKMINDFYDSIQSKSNNELIGELIRKMNDYVKFHFSTEEKMFQDYNYVEYYNHKKEHDEFIDKVTDLDRRFREGKIIVSFEITNFLKKWVIDHILKSDKKYSLHFTKMGLN